MNRRIIASHPRDAMSILREKGLLTHPKRPRQEPGMFLLDLHSHKLVDRHGMSHDAPPRAERLMPHPLVGVQK